MRDERPLHRPQRQLAAAAGPHRRRAIRSLRTGHQRENEFGKFWGVEVRSETFDGLSMDGNRLKRERENVEMGWEERERGRRI